MEANIIYDLEYFIKKFEAIKSEDIGINDLDNHCSLYHCGVRQATEENPWQGSEEANELGKIFHKNAKDRLANTLANMNSILSPIWLINDDSLNKYIEGNTPKERILNYLYSIRDNENTNRI